MRGMKMFRGDGSRTSEKDIEKIHIGIDSKINEWAKKNHAKIISVSSEIVTRYVGETTLWEALVLYEIPWYRKLISSLWK